jgi:hypothetical protein
MSNLFKTNILPKRPQGKKLRSAKEAPQIFQKKFLAQKICQAEFWEPVLPVFKPKIWLNFGRSCNGNIFMTISSFLRPNGIFYGHLVHICGHLVHFVVIWYIFGICIYPVLECCTEKNPAALQGTYVCTNSKSDYVVGGKMIQLKELV